MKRRRLAAKRMEAAEARVAELVKRERRRVSGGRRPPAPVGMDSPDNPAGSPANGS